MYASARDVVLDVAELARPPQQTTVAESAARNLRIVNPSGAAGNWSPTVTPYMIEPMNLARSRLYEAVVFVGPARSGKTIALVDGVLSYSVCDDPADCMIVQTNQSTAEDFSKTRISRAIAGSPELAKRLSPRGHDDNVLLKFFRSGMCVRFGWPSLGQLSGKDIRRVLMTDVDNITGDLSIDEAFGLALKRTQTYMSAGICIAESSPGKDYVEANWSPRTPHEAPPATGILSLYNRGDRRRLYWQCVDCKEPFEAAPGIERFGLPSFEELVESARSGDILSLVESHSLLICPHCGVGIEAKHKRAMTAAARWVGEGQKLWPDGSVTGERLRTRIASLWMGGVAAAYQPWSSLVERYLQAVKAYATNGDTKALKTTVNVDQAMAFLPPSAKSARKPHELQERAEPHAKAFVPAGVRYLTAQVDVQAGRRRGFVVQVQGWGPHREHWFVDRFPLRLSDRPCGNGEVHPIDPAGYVEDWDCLISRAITRRYPLADGSGRTMPVRLTVCDLGGEDGVTNRAYEFWRKISRNGLGHKLRLVKGGANQSAPPCEQKFPDTRNRKDRSSGSAGDVPVLMLNTDRLKDTVFADLARTSAGPGYYHFPDWFNSQNYEELTAETRGAKGWRNLGNSANETLDLCQYGEAAVIYMKADKINWSAPPSWARDWDSNPDVLAENETPAAPRRKPLRVARSNYLGS